jgi:hypothetical protein
MFVNALSYICQWYKHFLAAGFKKRGYWTQFENSTTAKLVRHLTLDQAIAGSSPASSAIKSLAALRAARDDGPIV